VSYDGLKVQFQINKPLTARSAHVRLSATQSPLYGTNKTNRVELRHDPSALQILISLTGAAAALPCAANHASDGARPHTVYKIRPQ